MTQSYGAPKDARVEWSTDARSVSVEAVLLANRLDTRALGAERQRGLTPPAVRLGDDGLAILFRYGVIVFVASGPEDRAELIGRARAHVTAPIDPPITELIEVFIGSDEHEHLVPAGIDLNDLSLERLLVVADVLAKSVVLDHHERTIAVAFDRIEPLAESLQRHGRGGRRARELLQHIGNALLVEQRTVWRVEVDEKPEILWDRPDLERLYFRLAEEYELKERHAALERKIALVARTAQTLLDLLWAKRSLRVEWYIVLLIVVEIMLSLAGAFR